MGFAGATGDTKSPETRSKPVDPASALFESEGVGCALFSSGPLCVKVVTSMRYLVRSRDMGDGSPEFMTPWAQIVASFGRVFPITTQPRSAVIELRCENV